MRHLQDFSKNFEIIKRVPHTVDFLVFFMPLPGHQNDVTFTSHCAGCFDGFFSVGNGKALVIVFRWNTGLHVFYDGIRIFGAGVVAGEYDGVGVLARGPGHERALGAVAVAAAAAVRAARSVAVGPKTDLNFLNSAQETFDQQLFDYTEETVPNLNPGFSFFDASDFSVDNFPPLDANMGTINIKKPGETVLSRKVRGVSLVEPLLQVTEQNGQREAVLFGENIWKWRVQSYRNEKSFKNFDEFIGKLVRYLATTKPKSRFSLDYESVYEGTNNAKIKATYFDRAYEFDGNAVIDLKLKHTETGELSQSTMLLKNGYFEADLTNLLPGKYSFTAKVINENLSKSGSFTILDFDVEQRFLSSDHKKLARLANSTEGIHYFSNQTNGLVDELMADARFSPVQKSDQNIVSLIDFRLLLALIAATLAIEWFIRKYNGLN